MASKEQEALDDIIKDFNEFNKKDIMFVPPQYDFDVLQQAIDDLEIKDKALDNVCYNYILEKLNHKVSKKTCYKLAQEEKQKLLKESEKQNGK